jgi:hypothetical protein
VGGTPSEIPSAGDLEMIVGWGTFGAGEWQISEIRAEAVWF